MEILHVFGIEWKLITIQLINFAVLMFILHRYVYKPLLAIIEKRQWLINQGLDTQEEVKKEKAKLVTEREEILLQAKQEASSLVLTLRKEGEETAKSLVHTGEEKARAIIERAEKDAIATKNEFLKESERELAKLAVLGAEKILREKLGTN